MFKSAGLRPLVSKPPPFQIEVPVAIPDLFRCGGIDAPVIVSSILLGDEITDVRGTPIS